VVNKLFKIKIMKKITFFFLLLTVSLGYSQVVLENFEGTTDFSGFEGLGGANVVADPAPGGTNGQVGEIISSSAGEGWQGAQLIMQSNFMDLTTDITVEVEVYSTSAFLLLAKVEDNINSVAADSAADEAHTGSGWETLTFTFNESLDGTAPANGEYSQIAFFPNWNGTGWNTPPGDFTIYVNEITAVQGSSIGGGGTTGSFELQEDFEALPASEFSGFEGLAGANIVADPEAGGTNGQVGEIISSSAGQGWQGAQLLMQTNFMDLSTNNMVEVDVYSTTAFTMLAKVEDQINNTASDSAADESHTGSGWETLTFTFNESLDGTAPADGEYNLIAFFPNWNGSGFNTPPGDFTVYVDNVRATTGSPFTAPDPDPEAAPIPTVPDGEVYSIYNDTNSYTTVFPFAYDFGSVAGEPDLDTGAGENKALKYNFSVAGYGAGEGGPDDVSAYNFVSFDYYAKAGVPGFRMVMISNDGGVTEHNYEIGIDEAIVTEAWTKVVIPMSFFTNLGFSETNFFQWKMDPFMQDVAQGGTVYIDNILLTTGNPLSVNNFETASFKAFPNPTNGNWNISGTSVISKVAVYDILGKQVVALEPNATETVIDASSLKTGVYFARIESNNGSKTVKLVKQ
jgi:hypothetical protein